MDERHSTYAHHAQRTHKQQTNQPTTHTVSTRRPFFSSFSIAGTVPFPVQSKLDCKYNAENIFKHTWAEAVASLN